jgi:hypothetical protein
MAVLADVLQQARSAGFRLGVGADGSLTVEGPTSKPEIIEVIKAHKDAIIASLSTPPEAQLQRLRKGMDWLSTAWERAQLDSSQKLSLALVKNLHRWADLDGSLRYLYPGWTECPLDGCSEDQPVVCGRCADAA